MDNPSTKLDLTILDGATGTELRKRGMPLGVCTEQWILENPIALIEIQRAYADAGSNAIYAPTFGLNRHSLSTLGLGNIDIRDWARRLVNLSREAVGWRCMLGGDIAPTGILPQPDADYDSLVDIFAGQADALENAGVDFFAVETQMSLFEARAAITAIQSVSVKPIFVSFAVTDSGRTIYGDSITDALQVLQTMDIAAFGINCTGDLNLMEKLLAELHPISKIPLLAKPNAGMPKTVDGHEIYDLSPLRFAEHLPGLINAGARLVGGCCGTTPEHISFISNAANAFRA